MWTLAMGKLLCARHQIEYINLDSFHQLMCSSTTGFLAFLFHTCRLNAPENDCKKMALFSNSKIRGIKSATPSSSDLDSHTAQPKDDKDVQTTSQTSIDTVPEESLDRDAQIGIRRIQALATVWSKSNLIAAYTLYFLPTITYRDSWS